VRYSTQAWLSAAGIKSTRKGNTAMTIWVFDKIYKIELPIPFQLKTTNVFFVDESPRTLVDTGIKTEASFEALKKGMEAIGFSFKSIERILITHGHMDHYG
jgi:glyoxylase-like metal-dependent hydrolase (beta-lactamase superfamily II)